MLLAALLLLPIVTATLLLVARPEAQARMLAMASTLVTAVVALLLWAGYAGSPVTAVDADWAPAIGLRLVLGYDGISLLMLVLTAVIFPFIIAAGHRRPLERPAAVNALLLYAQGFLFGVFAARNAFLFYIFYELALVPVFFLLLLWGGEGRRTITMRFFIYTLLGGLSLLFGLAWCVLQTPAPHSADFSALHALRLGADTQVWLFWALFLAFAIKLPILPFHSWQPDTYTVAPLQGTMVLGGVMLKMGLYGILRFVMPIVPLGVEHWRDLVIGLSIAGALYAGVIAFRQRDIKRMVAWSSLGHVGLLCAGLFAGNGLGITGSLFQAFAHAVLLVALLYVAAAVTERAGTADLDAMGGIKERAPRLAALFLLVLVNAVALPLTQSFVGEWLMFNGLWQHNGWMALAAVCTIVLGAIYMLWAYQRSMLGPGAGRTTLQDADRDEHLFLVPLIAISLVLGIYPAPVLELLQAPVQQMIDTLTALN